MISFPHALRYLFATHPRVMGRVLGIVYRAIAARYAWRAGFSCSETATGAVTLIQRAARTLPGS